MKRYVVQADDDGGTFSTEHVDGYYVLHDEAAARIAALKEQVQMYADSFARTMLERDAARTELAAARVNEARVATQVLKVRDCLIEQDYAEAWHQLYQIASPDFTSYTPWRELERLTNYSGPHSMDSQLAAEKGAHG